MRSIAVVVFAFALCACTRMGEQAHGGRHPWTQPDFLRIGVTSDPSTLNPLLGAQAVVENLLFNLSFDPLISFDEAGNAVPVLAETVPTRANGGISANGLTVTYRLRKNIRWQDGYPLTSHDVAFSFHAIMNPRNNVAVRSGYDSVASVQTPDDRTVVFHLKERFAPIVTKLFAGGVTPPGYVVPEHILARYASLNDVQFNAMPIGSGPFKVVAWKRGDSIEFVRNDRYLLGRPKLQRVTVKIIPNDVTALSRFHAREIDLLYGSADLYPAVRAHSDLTEKALLAAENRWFGIILNTSVPPLNDVRVRRAIAHAIDKRLIVHNVFHDAARVADGDIPDSLWAHSVPDNDLAYDPGRARSLLRAAGWSAKPLELQLTYASNSAVERGTAVLVQSMLSKVGIDVSVKGYPNEMLSASFGAGGLVDNGKFVMVIESVAAGVDPDDSWQVTCSAIPPGGFNDARYCNPLIDAAETTALTSYDKPTRKGAYAKVQLLLNRDVPVVFVAWPRRLYVYNSDFHGFAPSLSSAAWNAYRWSI